MAMSGVTLEDDVIRKYNKELKESSTLCCMILKLSDDLKKIIIDQTFEKDTLEFDDMKTLLPKDDPRYVLYDTKYVTENGSKNKKIVLICWVPDNSALKKKMMYASSKDAVKKAFDAVKCEIQASEISEVDYEEITGRLKKI